MAESGRAHPERDLHAAAVRLASLPRRWPLVEQVVTEAVSLPQAAAWRSRAQFVFFCGLEPPQMAGHEAQLEAVGRCLEWFVFDYPLPEHFVTPATAWLEHNRRELSIAQVHEVEAILRFVLGLFDVEEIEPGQGFTAVDLLRNARYPVQERVLTKELEPGQLLLGRLFPREGGYALSGMAALMEPHATEQIRDMIRRGRLRPEQILPSLDAIELENLLGRDPEAMAAAEDHQVLLARLNRFLELARPGEIEPSTLRALLETRSDAAALTAELCRRCRIACRHEIDLVHTLVRALSRGHAKGGP